MQKPAPSMPSVEHEDGGDGKDDEDEDYGEEYDDTRTFTVKDFKEQALRYAKDHYTSGTTQGRDATGLNGSEINNYSNNPFNKH